MKRYRSRGLRKARICMLLLTVILFAVLCGVSVIPVFRDVFGSIYYWLFPHQYTITNEHIEISNAISNPANNLQNKASVWMGTWDGKLYFSPRWCTDSKYKNKYYNYLACFDEHTVKRLFKAQDYILGISNGYVYYSDWCDTVSGRVKESIYAYDLQSSTKALLCETDLLTTEHYFSKDNSLFVSFNSQEGPYHLVSGAGITENTAPSQSYTLNGKTYSVRGIGASTDIVVIDQAGTEHEMKYDTPLGRQSLIPCNRGLLVHNEGEGNALYLIPDNFEEVVPLFNIPCTSAISAVNVYGDWAYLSISRYYFDETSDSTVPFKNDQLAGTYKIDLSNYSIEKISDNIYNGLYIFDDSGIYACTDTLEIYKLDFSGKKITQLLGYNKT